MKRWKIFGVTGLLAAGLLGGLLAPTTSSPEAYRRVAEARVPRGEGPRLDVEGMEPSGLPQLLAQEAPTPSPTPGAKRKKARNGDRDDTKNDYSELLKKPELVGFHPQQDQYEKVVRTIRQVFVEKVTDEQMMAGLKKELALFLEQAKVEGKPSEALAGVTVDQAFGKVQELYGSKVDKDLLGYVTIVGLLGSLKDPHSVLMTPKDMARFNEQLRSGSFGGIGIYIELDREQGNQLTVVEPMENSPAARAGLEAGDQIMMIDGKPTKGINIEVAQSLIRGPLGSTVRLTLQRRSQTLEVSIERGRIQVISVASKTFPGDIGYIRLRSFARDTKAELDRTLRKMKESQVKGIILDLRNNGGGYIDAAVGVVGQFVPAHSLVVYTIDRENRRKPYDSQSAGGVGVPVVVMINEYSASASEITAGALRDHKVARLVGDHSFGKGSVQELFPLTKDRFPFMSSEPRAEFKLTVARFYSPNGDVIDKRGIEPEVMVDMEPRFVGKAEQDIQLKKALELLGGRIN